MPKKKEISPSVIQEYMDLAFGILLLALFLASIILFITKGFLSDTEFASQLSNTLLSASGASGSAILYMRWNVTRRTEIKKAKPGEVSKVIEGERPKEEYNTEDHNEDLKG